MIFLSIVKSIVKHILNCIMKRDDCMSRKQVFVVRLGIALQTENGELPETENFYRRIIFRYTETTGAEPGISLFPGLRNSK